MKKTTIYLLIMLLSISTIPTSAFAAEKDPTTITNEPKEMTAEVKTMLKRLDEIKAMDKSELKSSEKKALRKEVRSIKATLRSTNNGVYLSVGAVIIIVLLLILLL